MGIILLFIAIAAILSYFIGRELKSEYFIDFCVTIFLGIFSAAYITVLIYLCVLAREPRYDQYCYQSDPIYSLSVHSQTYGRFFLGSGRIGSRLYYYKKEEKDGGYHLERQEACDVVIYEDDTVAPCIRRKVYHRDRAFLRFFVGNEKVSDIYEIVIPTKSLVKDFNPNY